MTQRQLHDSSVTDRTTRRALQVCDAAGAFIEYWGFKSIHGRIWSYLALRGKPIAQVEVARTLGVSRASISLAMSDLVDYGLVKPSSSNRNAPYEAIVDIWPVISDVLREREWMLIESARVALEALLEEVELTESFGESSKYDANRIRLLLNLTSAAQSFLRVLVSLRVPRAMDLLGTGLRKVSSVVQSLRDVR